MSAPIVLFDKSFLQSLSVDESVWFDHFFISNICPLFYVETLADLAKKVRPERTTENEVRIIADKFPEHGMPNYHHVALCCRSLMDNTIPMSGQIVIGGGDGVEVNGKAGVIVPQTEEADAFTRWRRSEFNEIERLYAKKWRQELSNPNLDDVKIQLRVFGIDSGICKTLEDAKKLSNNLVSLNKIPIDYFILACKIINIPESIFGKILLRWTSMNYPALASFAFYAAYVIKVEIFYRIALASNLISATRSSNRTDIAYLCYLPFCKIFVSTDRLHRDCAHLFLRSDQEFVWGPDLKDGLSQLNNHYSKLPNEIREKGLYEFAPCPPMEGNFLVSNLWDHHLPRWRKNKYTGPPRGELDENLKKILQEPSSLPQKPYIKPDDIVFLRMTHKIRIKKGSWYQVPKDTAKENPKQ